MYAIRSYYDIAIIKDGNNHHRTGMHDVFTIGGGCVREAYFVAANIQEFALEDHLSL